MHALTVAKDQFKGVKRPRLAVGGPGTSFDVTRFRPTPDATGVKIRKILLGPAIKLKR